MMKTKYNFSWYSFIKNTLLILIDFFAYITSVYFALQIRKWLPMAIDFVDFDTFSKQQYFTPKLMAFFGIIFIVFVWNHLYQKRCSFWEELLVVWRSLIISILISYLFLFNFNEVLPFMSRIVISLTFVLLMLFIPFYRSILKYILFRISFWRTPLIIACREESFTQAQYIASVFQKDFYLGFIPVGFYVENNKMLKHELPIYTKIEEIPINNTLCLLGDLTCDKLLPKFYSRYKSIYLVPSTDTLGFGGLGGQYLFSERLFILKIENKLNSIFSQYVKNIIDRILGFIIIFFLSPVFLLISIIIKIKSPGKVFYRQSRVGQKGKEFRIWKFRTMYQDADKKLQILLDSDELLKKEWDTYLKLKNDPRITPIGNFLRKYSLDELPQLINVICGDMSLIGPRPYLKGEIEVIDPLLLPIIVQVKPGLTGLWQVSGRNQTNRLERINIDLWYIHHWSLSLDLLVLLNTPIAVLSARGAR